MSIITERGEVNNLEIARSQGGKFVSTDATFELIGYNGRYRYDNMPKYATRDTQDELWNGDEIYVVYVKGAELGGYVTVLAIKNTRNGENFYPDVSTLFVMSAGIAVAFLWLCYFFYSVNGMNSLTVKACLVFIGIGACICIPMLRAASTRMKVRDIIDGL